MPDRSCVLVVTDAAKAAVNGVFDAMGLGPDNIAQPAGASSEGPVTHWFGHSFADQATSDAWLAYAEGMLPTVSYPWGMNGPPSEAEALAAVAGFTISVSAGEAAPGDHLNGILAGMGLTPVTA